MFQIVVDSGANIPAELVEQYDIRVIPFINYVDEEMIPGFEAGLTPEEERAKGKVFYDAMRNGAEVKTSLVNTGTFIEYFRPILEAGEDIIYYSLSKNISGTNNAATLAANALKEEFSERKIFVVDSLNASLAQGMLAIYASEKRAEGISIEEIAEETEASAHRMNGVFTVDSLKYLMKSGRVSNVAAIIAGALQIKPLLRGNADGYIEVFNKCHGRKKALNELVNLVCNNIVEPEKQFLGIAHADAYEDSLKVIEKITERIKVRGVINTSYDFCTGSHVGPGTIALFFLGKDRELGGHGLVIPT